MSDRKGPRDFLSTAEVNLLGTDSDAAIARKLGRTTRGIETARLTRDIPSFRERESAKRWARWDARLGTLPDTEIARRANCSAVAVLKRRHKLGIAPFKGTDLLDTA